MENIYRYLAFAVGFKVLYHFIMYKKYPMSQIEQELGVQNGFNVSDKTRYLIASCIAIPAIIIELLGWKEAGWTPLNPIKVDKQKKLFGGIYDYIRHPIYLCEFSWFATLSILMNSPFLLITSGIIAAPCCYHMCRSDEMQAINHFGDEYKRYMDKTGMFFPKMSQ